MEQEKAIGELSERKKAFFAHKNQWIKRGPKVALFHGLVEKLRLKKLNLTIKKRVKKAQNLHFSKGVFAMVLEKNLDYSIFFFQCKMDQ